MTNYSIVSIEYAPWELQDAVRQFWREDEWDNAVSIASLESNWNAFAENDTRDPDHPCGSVIGVRDHVVVTAEWSIGWFQINACNLAPGWKPEHLFNTYHNCGTAHAMWAERGWEPWYFSAKKLGLL